MQLTKQTNPLRLIPHQQLPEFYEETEKARAWVTRWIAVLDPLIGQRGTGAMFPVIAAAMNSTPGTVKNRFYAWRDGKLGKCSPIWENLIDRSLFPKPSDTALPVLFIEHWKALYERHQRGDSGLEAHRALLNQLDHWHKGGPAIPGFPEPPALDSYCAKQRRKVPRGWSYRNLMNHKPSKFARVFMQQGPKKASEYLPSNYATRAGLHFLERVFFDDQHYDQKVVVPGLNQGRPFRPLGFNALDHLTAAFIDYRVKLTRWDDEAGKQRQLTGIDFVWMVLSMLQGVGYRSDKIGTTLIFEHGTASGYAHKDASDDRSFDELLYHFSGGKVSIDRSGRFDQPFLAQALFRGRGKQSAGNPRFKSPIESIFHLVRTRSSALLGQVGSNQRLNGPEADEALDRYTRNTLAAIDKLPAGRRARVLELVRLPFFEFHDWAELMREIYGGINARTAHNLEGWDACRFTCKEYQLQGIDQPISIETFQKFTDEQKAAIQAIGTPIGRFLSPAEAVAKCVREDKGRIERFDFSVIPGLIPREHAHLVTVTKKHEIHIRDLQHFGSESMIYLASIRDHRGVVDLQAGQKFLAYLNPYLPDRMAIADTENRYLGTVDRWIRPTANDRAGYIRNQAVLNEHRARLTGPIERRHATVADQLKDDVDFNRRLISGEPATDEEIADHRRRARSIASASLDDVTLAAIHDTTDHTPAEPEPDDFADVEDIDDSVFAWNAEIDGPREEF